MMEMAEQLVRSGLLPSSIKTPAAALAIIQTGQELGLPPMYALRKISIISGRPVVEAEVMLAMVYRDHGDNAVLFEETNDQRCVLKYKRRGWKEYRPFSFTIEDAKTAGLLSKDTWRQYPGAMLRARCISAMARVGFPDTLGGLYTHEELGAAVEMVDGEIVPTSHPVAPVNLVRPTAETVERHRAEDHNAAWHVAVRGTRFADDDVRHAYVGAFTNGRIKSLSSYLEQANEEQADALVESVKDRIALEQEYTRLAALAVEKGHKDATKIRERPAADLTDAILERSVAVLQVWEQKLPTPVAPVAVDDGDEPF
jgi:hypothetical protein